MAGNVVEQLIIQIAGDSTKFKKAIGEVQKSNKTGQDSFKKFAKIGAASFLTVEAAALALGKKALGEFQKFETGITNVAKTTGLAGQDLEDFKDDIVDLSEEIPVGTEKLNEIATAAGQLGIQGKEDLVKFTKTIALLGATTDLEGEEAALTIAKILNLTGESVDTVDTFGSAIVDLGNNFATSESAILEVAKDLSKATVQFGLSSTEILGMSTAMSSLGIASEAGGTVVGKAFARINEIILEGSGPAFKELVRITGISGDALEETFDKNASEVFTKFIGNLEEASGGSKFMASKLNELGLSGIRVEKILPTLASRSDLLTDAMARGAEAAKENTALNNEASEAFSTSANKMLTAQNKIDNAFAKLGEDIAPAAVDAIESIADVISDNREVLGLLGSLFSTTVKIVGGLVTALGKLVGGIAAVSKAAGDYITNTHPQIKSAYKAEIDSTQDLVDAINAKSKAMSDASKRTAETVVKEAKDQEELLAAFQANTAEHIATEIEKTAVVEEEAKKRSTIQKKADTETEAASAAAMQVHYQRLMQKHQRERNETLRHINNLKDIDQDFRDWQKSERDIAQLEDEQSLQYHFDEVTAIEEDHNEERNGVEQDFRDLQKLERDAAEYESEESLRQHFYESQAITDSAIEEDLEARRRAEDYLAEIEEDAARERLERVRRTGRGLSQEQATSMLERREQTRQHLTDEELLYNEYHDDVEGEETNFNTSMIALRQALGAAETSAVENTANELAALQNSKNSDLKEIGKTAALVQIGISTAESAMKAFNGLAWIPYVGWALGGLAAAAVVAYGMEKAGQVRAMKEGGIVPGVGTGDKVPALLEPGELVVPRSITQDILKEYGSIKFSEGGMVPGQGEASDMQSTFWDIFSVPQVFKQIIGGNDPDSNISGFGAAAFVGMLQELIPALEEAARELEYAVYDAVPGGAYLRQAAEGAGYTQRRIQELMQDNDAMDSLKDIIGEEGVYNIFGGSSSLDSITDAVSDAINRMGGDIFMGIGGALGFQKGGIVGMTEPGEMRMSQNALQAIASGANMSQNRSSSPIVHRSSRPATPSRQTVGVEIMLNDNAAEIINAQVREGRNLGTINPA